MNHDTKAFESFLEKWVEAFSRAVETFGGEKPSVSLSPLPQDELRDSSGFLWWKQPFAGKENFILWIGASDATWPALSNSPDDSANARQTYTEILHQTLLDIATTSERTGSDAVQALPAAQEAPSNLEVLAPFKIQVFIRQQKLPPMIAAFEISDNPGLDEAAFADSPESADPSDSPILWRLMDLELPLSVVLGRAVLPIREVLKLTSGSLVELDRAVGDSVDLMVHGTIVARGEIVSVKGNYGIRIKEIMSRRDRMALHNRAA